MTTIKIEKNKLLEMIGSIVKNMEDEKETSEKKPVVEMSKKELKEMVTAVLENSFTPSGIGPRKNPIMAKREIIAMMDTTSRSFEREILKTFNLRDPDELSPDLQKKYLEIVEEMKTKLVGAAMAAVQQLIGFPSNDESK